VNGTDVPGRERVWALGPGALFRLSRMDFIFANVYFEQDARDRPEGDRYRLRYVHLF
jgi:anthranilate 1,2-dioxygenase (deaminating, decarboxylating) large subunit